MTLRAEHHAATGCILGEGPVWHDGALWLVDIERHTLNRLDADDHASFDAGQRIGFAAPTDAGDWIVGLQSGLARWSPGRGAPSIFLDPEPDKPTNRFNDAKADPAGRLYAGTLELACKEPLAALYRIDPGLKATVLLEPVTISNGLAWDATGNAMYYTDTPTQRITRFDWDPETGDIRNPTTVIRFDETQGSPDGMTIDRKGNLYTAMWGGAAVLVIDPTAGAILETIAVDAPHVTSCTFGGPDLATLFITTARAGLTREQLEAHPQSGDVFAAKLSGAEGLPVSPVRTAGVLP